MPLKPPYVVKNRTDLRAAVAEVLANPWSVNEYLRIAQAEQSGHLPRVGQAKAMLLAARQDLDRGSALLTGGVDRVSNTWQDTTFQNSFATPAMQYAANLTNVAKTIGEGPHLQKLDALAGKIPEVSKFVGDTANSMRDKLMPMSGTSIIPSDIGGDDSIWWGWINEVEQLDAQAFTKMNELNTAYADAANAMSAATLTNQISGPMAAQPPTGPRSGSPGGPGRHPGGGAPGGAPGGGAGAGGAGAGEGAAGAGAGAGAGGAGAGEAAGAGGAGAGGAGDLAGAGSGLPGGSSGLEGPGLAGGLGLPPAPTVPNLPHTPINAPNPFTHGLQPTFDNAGLPVGPGSGGLAGLGKTGGGGGLGKTGGLGGVGGVGKGLGRAGGLENSAASGQQIQQAARNLTGAPEAETGAAPRLTGTGTGIASGAATGAGAGGMPPMMPPMMPGGGAGSGSGRPRAGTAPAATPGRTRPAGAHAGVPAGLLGRAKNDSPRRTKAGPLRSRREPAETAEMLDEELWQVEQPETNRPEPRPSY